MTETTQVRVREPKERFCYVPITDKDKPTVCEDIIENWKRLLDMVATILKVPSTLVMNIQSGEIEVFLKDSGADNPYEIGEKASLKHGLYCETVIGNSDILHVPNSLESETWKDNPDVDLNMISYLGLPITWPDSEIFGTICVLDSKTREYSEEQIQLLGAVQSIIQKDLKLLDGYRELQTKLSKHELMLREMTHRTKNSFNSVLGFCQISQYNTDNAQPALEKIESMLWNCVSLYKELCYNSNGSDLALISFTEQLMQIILKSHMETTISFEVTGDDCLLSPERASLLGEVISELVTNSIKYAYEGIPESQRHIQIVSKISESYITIKFKDNGVGLPDDIEKVKSSSIGWQIISNLLKCYKGGIEVVTGPGGHVSFGIKTDS